MLNSVKMSKVKRIWGYVPEELYNDIQEIADREFRKLNPMITLLLQLAVKEKNRKRNGKKVHTGRNTTDIHQDDSQ